MHTIPLLWVASVRKPFVYNALLIEETHIDSICAQSIDTIVNLNVLICVYIHKNNQVQPMLKTL